ncbi:PTS transporter subunit EIIC [Phormidium tenue FACHB-886]|nr:PTS transporter subunit EIIC [Phormidium tenue FACHB-886]
MAGFSSLQKLGRALMLPIAVLPAAGLLLRLGAPDLLNIPVMTKAGGAVFENLPAIFATGVAIGFSRDGAGAAGLAGLVGYFVLTIGAKTINDTIDMGVLAGIIAGVIAGLLYNRFYNIKLPDFLGFFGGKRFVPIITGGVALGLAILFGYLWPPVQVGIQAVGNWITSSGAIGAFVFGTLNRLLIPVGLHHILNNLLWFVFGSFTKADGTAVTGDLSRFLAGDPTAGTFMTGFYPVMMFGLPLACLAMVHMARPERRRATAGIMLSMALTSFLTGITEPIEFTFMFLAPVLYVIHALLTGISMALMNILGVRHGFTFSAGALDFVLNYGLSTKGWMILVVGLVYGAIYYLLFRFLIQALNLKTPGREEMDLEHAQLAAAAAAPTGVSASGSNGAATGATNGVARSGIALTAQRYLDALGGAQNLKSIDACTTRLRLTLVERDRVADAAIRAVGAKGVIRPGVDAMQVIIGPEAELIAEEMKTLVAAPAPSAASIAPAIVTATVPTVARSTASASLAQRYLEALGGRNNVQTIDACATRLRLTLNDRDSIQEASLKALGAKDIIRPGLHRMQVILNEDAEAIASEIRKLL